MNNSKLKSASQCVHSGTLEDPFGGGVNSPIITSSAFGFLDVEENTYPRYFNTPNQKAVVDKLCTLEKGEAGLVLSSGMAAISTAFVALLKPGDHVIMQDQIYGGTYYFVKSQLDKLGVSHTMVKGTALDAYRKAILPNSKLLYFETPSNPLLSVVNIAGMAQLARDHGMVSMIDNTFASPINQTPIELGVDLVMHSGTKYLGGHSDICFGALITSGDLREELQSTAVNWGCSLNAHTCYQIERSLKTLFIRVQRQNENALYLSEKLDLHPEVKQVYYPGLVSHPGHKLASSQMSGFGGMLSFELKKQGAAVDFCKKLQLIKPALSLGGVETIISIPCLTSHIKMTKEERLEAGVSDDLLRLSVGIEDPVDLLEDIEEALD
jgi:cystathionine beta-lyase